MTPEPGSPSRRALLRGAGLVLGTSAVTLAGAALPTVLGTAAAMTLVWGGVAGLVVLAVVGAVRSRRS